jgi:hypothetical protein
MNIDLNVMVLVHVAFSLVRRAHVLKQQAINRSESYDSVLCHLQLTEKGTCS